MLIFSSTFAAFQFSFFFFSIVNSQRLGSNVFFSFFLIKFLLFIALFNVNNLTTSLSRNQRFALCFQNFSGVALWIIDWFWLKYLEMRFLINGEEIKTNEHVVSFLFFSLLFNIFSFLGEGIAIKIFMWQNNAFLVACT